MDTPKSLNKPLHNVGGVFGAALSIAMGLSSACGPLPCEKTLTCAPDDSSTGGNGTGGDGDGDGDMGGARGDGDGDGDECQEDETQEGSTECGFNDRGALQEVCVDGRWKDGSTCLDPDECQDDEIQNGSDSCGDDGVVVERCEEGEWIKTSDCNEDLECTGDAEQAGETSCGLNGRGQLTQECVDGFWKNTDDCDDPDECVDGAVESAAACPGGDGSTDDFCVEGEWTQQMCVLDDVYLASVDSGGVPGGKSSSAPSISATGRFVAFDSSADNLVAGDTNDAQDVFVHDMLTGETTRVSVASSGVQGNADSRGASISGDGRVVAFNSFATNLAPGNTNEAAQVFVHDRESGETWLVSVSSEDNVADDRNYAPVLSYDGGRVAFRSDATNLVSDDDNAVSDIFLHDRPSGTTTRVSVGLAGQEADGLSRGPTLSADGNLVAFDSEASNLVANDTNAVSDVFVYDVEAEEMERVSVDAFGNQGNGASWAASVAAEGGHIAYVSDATNLVEVDTNDGRDVFVYNRTTGEVTLASLNVLGQQVKSGPTSLRISSDGRLVQFYDYAGLDGYLPGEPEALLFVHDMQTGGTKGLNRNAAGVYVNGGIAAVATMSADGRFVVLQSASAHVAHDSVNEFDIYVFPVWED